MKPAKSRRGGIVLTSLLTLLVLGLTGAVVYLLSERNHRLYRLVVENKTLHVQRGRFLPVGYQSFSPQTPSLKQAYAALPIPEHSKSLPSQVFHERNDLDRAMFGLLVGWAREVLSQTDGDVAKATLYIDRCHLLPGVSGEQRSELKTLRGDLAFEQGVHKVDGASGMLQQALEDFRESLELGTKKDAQARDWIEQLRKRIALYDSIEAPRPKPQLEAAPEKTETSETPTPEEEDKQPNWKL